MKEYRGCLSGLGVSEYWIRDGQLRRKMAWVGTLVEVGMLISGVYSRFLAHPYLDAQLMLALSCGWTQALTLVLSEVVV